MQVNDGCVLVFIFDLVAEEWTFALSIWVDQWEHDVLDDSGVTKHVCVLSKHFEKFPTTFTVSSDEAELVAATAAASNGKSSG